MERPSVRPRSATRGHLLPLLGAEGPSSRVQDRSVRDVQGTDERRREHLRGGVVQGLVAQHAIEIAVPGGAPGAPAALRPPPRTLTGPAGGQPGGGRRPAPVVATKPAADGLITSSEPAPMRVPRPATPEPAFARNPYAGVGRNDPCPCGSGKKFKKCHGAA